MTKMASESPATKIEEPKTDMLFTGKACLAIKGFVSTLFFTSSEFSQIFCTELVLTYKEFGIIFKRITWEINTSLIKVAIALTLGIQNYF